MSLIRDLTLSIKNYDYDKLMQELSADDFTINRKTVTKLIKQIKLLSDDEIELTLINGQTIRKE